jgi:hypothetical protein
MYNEIQGYKQTGFTIRSCARAIGCDRKTVRKYRRMEPDEYVRYAAACRERTKILDPYRAEITATSERYPSVKAAIIHGRLRANHEKFEPSYRSVRAYVTALREEPGIPAESKIRQYAEVAELPPGFQSFAVLAANLRLQRQKPAPDMFGKNKKVYLFAMVMRRSRKKFVYFQDRPFNAEAFAAELPFVGNYTRAFPCGFAGATTRNGEPFARLYSQPT